MTRDRSSMVIRGGEFGRCGGCVPYVDMGSLPGNRMVSEHRDISARSYGCKEEGGGGPIAV